MGNICDAVSSACCGPLNMPERRLSSLPERPSRHSSWRSCRFRRSTWGQSPVGGAVFIPGTAIGIGGDFRSAGMVVRGDPIPSVQSRKHGVVPNLAEGTWPILRPHTDIIFHGITIAHTLVPGAVRHSTIYRGSRFCRCRRRIVASYAMQRNQSPSQQPGTVSARLRWSSALSYHIQVEITPPGR